MVQEINSVGQLKLYKEDCPICVKDGDLSGVL